MRVLKLYRLVPFFGNSFKVFRCKVLMWFNPVFVVYHLIVFLLFLEGGFLDDVFNVLRFARVARRVGRLRLWVLIFLLFKVIILTKQFQLFWCQLVVSLSPGGNTWLFWLRLVKLIELFQLLNLLGGKLRRELTSLGSPGFLTKRHFAVMSGIIGSGLSYRFNFVRK